MKYQWIYLPYAEKTEVLNLATKLKVDPVIANMFIQRGIKTYQQAERFFNIRYADLYDPFEMNDMDKAVSRFVHAINNFEKIMILGDYDVDGTTGTALLYNVLTQFYKNIIYYIPDRYKEGYGVSFQAVDYAHKQNVKLIISVDCGIKANDKVDYAKTKNIDFIILDHHTPSEQLPAAVAVLDPKRQDNTYPFNELSGAGVAFKFLQALARKGLFEEKEIIPYLDLLALSIAADIVPIIDENRILAYYGLKILNQTPSLGIQALKEVAGYKKDQKLSIGQIIFGLAPRINAAGRIEHGAYAVQLLIAKDYNYALELARKIDKLNRQRQNLQDRIVKQITQSGAFTEQLKHKNSTVLYHPAWHKGVVGIVASKIIDKFYKPTIILTSSDGKITGSARSVHDFDLYSAIENCQQWLINFGGHKYAAGLTLEEKNLQNFIDCFEQVVSERITPEQRKPVLKIVGELSFTQINERLVKILRRLQPYGPGNPRPVFVTRNVRDTGYSRLVGRNEDILLLQLEDPSGGIFKAIGYGLEEYYPRIEKREKFDIAYTIEENEFNGIKSIQLEVKDIRFTV